MQERGILNSSGRMVGKRGGRMAVGATWQTLASSVTPYELLCGLGLACNFVWCTLEGHSEGFVASLRGLDEFVNSRIFFQLGFFLIASLMIAVPRLLERAARPLDVCIPVASCVATVAFAEAFEVGGDAAAPMCVAGLLVSGVGYCWLVTRFYLVIMHRRGFVSAVVATVLCLLIKEALLAPLLTLAPAGLQIAVAASMPLCMAALLFAAGRFGREGASGQAGAPQDPVGYQVELYVVFAVVFALLLSVVRGYSRLGMWGVGDLVPSFAPLTLLRTVALALAVAAFAGLAIIPQAGKPVAIRFHAPIVVVCAGFLIVGLQFALDSDRFLSFCLQVEECFAHLAFWASACALIERRPDPVLRMVGIPLAVYSATSVLYVALRSAHAIFAFGLMAVVVYIAIVLLAHNMASLARNGGEAGGDHPAQARQSVLEAVYGSCEELACRYELSPREAQILPMVVEGRSRSYISNSLHLSDSTVKTHMSRIYAKLSVSNRQELVDLVFGTSSEQ